MAMSMYRAEVQPESKIFSKLYSKSSNMILKSPDLNTNNWLREADTEI